MPIIVCANACLCPPPKPKLDSTVLAKKKPKKKKPEFILAEPTNAKVADSEDDGNRVADSAKQ